MPFKENLNSISKIRDCIRSFERRLQYLFKKFGDTQLPHVKSEIGAINFAIRLFNIEREKLIQINKEKYPRPISQNIKYEANVFVLDERETLDRLREMTSDLNKK